MEREGRRRRGFGGRIDGEMEPGGERRKRKRYVKVSKRKIDKLLYVVRSGC